LRKIQAANFLVSQTDSRIIVLGYYDILSRDSDGRLPRAPEAVLALVPTLQQSALDELIKADAKQQATGVSAFGQSGNLRNNIIEKALKFGTLSCDNIESVVGEVNSAGNAPAAAVAIPPFSSYKSAYASGTDPSLPHHDRIGSPALTWIWEAKKGSGRVGEWPPPFLPMDEVRDVRRQACNAEIHDDNRVGCYLASVGHPNAGGAATYAAAILDAYHRKAGAPPPTCPAGP
jgi:hypothetical protein